MSLMAGDYTYKIHINRLNAVDDLLTKHYGLGVTYFETFGNRQGEYIEIVFPCSYEDFIACFKSEREFINNNGNVRFKKTDLPNSPENALVIDAIWLTISICCQESWFQEMPDTFQEYIDILCQDKDLFNSEEYMQDYLCNNYDDWLDQFYDAKARKDLLELYLYHKRKPKGKDDPSQLTIKYGKGKSIKLENKDNWFERVLLHNHFKKYLPDIKSEEDAINALNVLNHKGRKLQRPLMYHFIYGTYSMVSEHLGKKSVSESFCDLLRELMEQMDYPTVYLYKDKLREMDNQYIRKMISKLKQEAQKYTFNIDVFLNFEQAKPHLRKSGRFLYERMV